MASRVEPPKRIEFSCQLDPCVPSSFSVDCRIRQRTIVLLLQRQQPPGGHGGAPLAVMVCHRLFTLENPYAANPTRKTRTELTASAFKDKRSSTDMWQ
jgi:hypothetical protein